MNNTYANGNNPPQQNYRQPPPQQSFRQPPPQQPVYTDHAASNAPYTGGGSGGYQRGFSTPRLPSFEWGTIGKIAIGIIGFVLVIFLLSKVSGIFGGSPSVSVNIDAAYFSDGTFDDVKIVVDGQYYNYLDENMNNKLAADLEREITPSALSITETEFFIPPTVWDFR